MITENQFSVLVQAESARADVPLTQRFFVEKTGLSIGTVNKTVRQLTEDGLLDSTGITDLGRQALEPFRAKRAILLAAGFGSRMVPVTLNTPKPLVRVHGVRIIDTLLDAVLAAGIEEIIVVRGYLGEQFDQLLSKYPMIRFVENPLFNETNNISSVMLVRHLLQNAYVFEADTILYNKSLITKYQYASNYLAKYVEKTDDWCFHLNRGIITKALMGGANSYLWYGISYWSAADGAKLEKHIPEYYATPGGKERIWDMVALEAKKSEYKIRARLCTEGDIVEVDSFKELKAVDPAYRVE